jgi:hypothetical protein
MSTVTVAPKKFWEGTGFWVGLSLLFFSAWSGFNTETGDAITKMVLEIFGGGFAIRNLVKNSKLDLVKWIKDPNTWVYLTAFFSAIFGEWLTTIIPQLQKLVEAISAGNFQAILSAGVSFLVSVYYLIRDRAGAQLATITAEIQGTND